MCGPPTIHADSSLLGQLGRAPGRTGQSAGQLGHQRLRYIRSGLADLLRVRGIGSGSKQLRLKRDQIRFRLSHKDLLGEGAEERSRFGKIHPAPRVNRIHTFGYGNGMSFRCIHGGAPYLRGLPRANLCMHCMTLQREPRRRAVAPCVERANFQDPSHCQEEG